MSRPNKEEGLEIPLNLMAGLGEASRVTKFGGGLVIKGILTLFCPTQRIGNSVLWHSLFNDDGSRISYLAADQSSCRRALIQDVDAACLERSRNFLGWAAFVEVHAGMCNTFVYSTHN